MAESSGASTPGPPGPPGPPMTIGLAWPPSGWGPSDSHERARLLDITQGAGSGGGGAGAGPGGGAGADANAHYELWRASADASEWRDRHDQTNRDVAVAAAALEATTPPRTRPVQVPPNIDRSRAGAVAAQRVNRGTNLRRFPGFDVGGAGAGQDKVDADVERIEAEVDIKRDEMVTKIFDGNEDKVPGEFCCPITYLLFVEPVIAPDGHTYEKSAIKNWMTRSDKSPKTNLRMDKTLTPNHHIRGMIWDFDQFRCWCSSGSSSSSSAAASSSVCTKRSAEEDINGNSKRPKHENPEKWPYGLGQTPPNACSSGAEAAAASSST